MGGEDAARIYGHGISKCLTTRSGSAHHCWGHGRVVAHPLGHTAVLGEWEGKHQVVEMVAKVPTDCVVVHPNAPIPPKDRKRLSDDPDATGIGIGLQTLHEEGLYGPPKLLNVPQWVGKVPLCPTLEKFDEGDNHLRK